MAHSAYMSSATYDEVTYLRVAANWWLTGNQSNYANGFAVDVLETATSPDARRGLISLAAMTGFSS